MSNATLSYKRQHGLTVEQQNAVELVALGQTDSQVAEAVQVHRVTVTKWRLYDPWFEAAVNRQRADIWSGAGDRLRAMLPKALDVLEQSLNSGSERTALALVKLTGLDMINPPDGPQDPDSALFERVDQRMCDLARRREKRKTLDESFAELADPDRMVRQERRDRRRIRRAVLREIQGCLPEGAEKAPNTNSELDNGVTTE